MTSMLSDTPRTNTGSEREDEDNQPFQATIAEQLQENSAAIRIGFTWFGTRKSLSEEHKQTIASGFDAESRSILAGKKIINTAHPKFKAVTAVKSRVLNDWKDSSLPFPEPGIRLIRRDQVEVFQARMEGYAAALSVAVAELDEHLDEMLREARTRLGALYNPQDYPETLQGLFGVAWDFPNVEPPDYLMRLKPALYEAERARVEGQFNEAVRLAEEAFTEQFAQAIGHLCSRLGRGEDGSPLIFRDSAVENLNNFFERFRSLGLRSNAQLDDLVHQAQLAVRGASPNRLRTSTDFRQNVAQQLSAVESQLSELMVARPRRRIQRPTNPANPTPDTGEDE